MNEGRSRVLGQVIPLATAVADARYCFGYSDQPKQGRPKLLCAGREHCKPDFHVSRSDFACTLVEFVVEGKGTLKVGNTTFDLFPGIIFSYGMDSSHDIWSSATNPMTKYFTAYLEPTQPPVGKRMEISPGDIRWSRDRSTLQTLFDELIQEGQRSGEQHEKMTALYLQLILLKAGEAIPPVRERMTKTGDTYQRALECIESSYSKLNTLDDLGAIIGEEGNYLCRLFRRFGQETPIQCITRHKLNRAAEMLLTDSLPVNQIASKVGYEDPYYFSRIFRKRFGLSPRQFRVMAKETKN